MNTLKLLCSLIFQIKEFGHLWVCNGSQEIEIHTCFTPDEVYVSLGDVCATHGCGAGNDCFDIKIVEGGFVIVCDIKSNRRKIKWLALK
jgi:hypothetical protein